MLIDQAQHAPGERDVAGLVPLRERDDLPSVDDPNLTALRREPDPLRRGRRATQLLATHRAFYGVGPLDVALPGRRILAREDRVVAAEDDAVGTHLTAEVEALAFITERVIIDPREEWEPEHDAVVVCGPASAHIGHVLMSEDPMISMRIGAGGRWSIVDETTGEAYTSPMDDETPRRADHAYLSRRLRNGHVVVHIVKLHALGSVGAAHYLTEHAPNLWASFGDEPFSVAVAGEFEGLTPTSVSVLIPPRAWTS